MRGPRTISIGAALALMAALLTPARADIIHLKNGGTITADAWEMKGDRLIIRQGDGRISVPRSEVARIETSQPARAETGQAAAGPTVAARDDREAATPAPPGDGTPMSDEQLQRAVEALKTRIAAQPMARSENTRRLVALLVEQGARSLEARDDGTAMTRFREALGYEPHDARAQLGLAVTYVHTDQDTYARSTLESAVVDHPDDAALHALLGDVYNGQERTAEALAEWKRAYELKPNDVLKHKIDKLTRERSIDESYRQSDGAHFTLKYDGERAGPDLGRQILDFLESQFTSLETRFDHYPLQPIVVILYPHRQFHEATQADSNVAGLYDGKIRVPIGGLSEINASARPVLVHELAHAFIAGKSHGTAPRWLHEGLAQRIEGKSTSAATGIGLAKEFRALERKEAWGETFTYPSALSFIEYLEERLGFHTFLEVFDEMARGATVDQAFERLTRYSLPELRRGWGESLVRKYLQ
ncbi:MAG TPA: tetratricopeptide repeat protein [Candidatus Polarisedimenticolia bacterium]|nr:tetratricopeptide repeat protein [Candidatus Polarisedimenticolia bacterium]